MKRLAFIILTLTLALGIATVASATHNTVKIRNDPTLGKYLSDNDGMPLYWFTKDSPGVSACGGSCLEKWPIYYRDKIVPPEGVPTEDFTTIVREDGLKQTSFRGYPLYYFFKDEEAGDLKGQAAREAWYIIDPDNFPLK
ncbi:hypothetical protein [Malonomonas rubra]|uniref:COG4315 family predicted lipoprotein n=1 Tax=Malonomonas rubra TaxID=57040 RepID=UPI0026EC8367|nr:hypothetical protein [Malonomonas rubra]